MSQTSSVVYFLRAPYEGGPVKIGFSRKFDLRLRALQSGVVGSLQVLRKIPGGRETEAWLHSKFAGSRISGEWFHFDEAMLTVEPPSVVAVSEDGVDEYDAATHAALVRDALRHAVAHYQDSSVVAGKKIGVTPRTVENFLSGAHAPNGAVMLRMMAAYPEVNAALMAKPLAAHWDRVSRGLAALEVAKQELQRQIDELPEVSRAVSALKQLVRDERDGVALAGADTRSADGLTDGRGRV